MHGCSNASSAAERQSVAVAARVLGDGGIVVYPTETLYGLGADASNAAALRRLLAVKGREAGKPVAVLVNDRDMLDALISDLPSHAVTLMQRFWPGPLTIVLSARPSVSPLLTGGSGGIGVRISSHPVAHAVVRALGRPLTSPSANPAGLTPPTEIGQARAYFGRRVDYYLDAGRLPGEPPSTVVDLRGEPRIVRSGAITAEAIRAAL
jgi:L-threonylcarbamoyladenylate synthase